MINGKEFLDWVLDAAITEVDTVDVLCGNTITVTRNAEIRDCLRLNDLSLKDVKNDILADPDDAWADFNARKKVRVNIKRAS